MQQGKKNVWLPLVISLAVVAGMWLGYKMRDSMPGKSFFHTERRRPVDEVLQLIESKYVDQVNANGLADTAIDAMLAKLDPHSQFIPARSVEMVNEDISGGFYGIGIEFGVFEDTFHVVNVIKDGPAFKAGLQTGDQILKAGDSILSGKKRDAESMRAILRGNRGSSIILHILRNNKPKEITVSRDIIPVSSVDAAYLLNDKTGYIKLNKFSQKTYREFMEALEGLQKKGAQQLVLDLRGNGGGILDEAVEIADEFLAGDKLITYTEGIHSPRKDYRCRREGIFEKGKLILLADEASASASEILMGALQDWDRATVIGRRTFGKGLVQEQYDLSDGSALRLTVSRYFTPLGRSIQRSYASGSSAYYKEVFERGIDTGVDKKAKTKVYTTKEGKKVFGGGGITPDINIGPDTGRLGNVVAEIYTKGLLNDFGYRYVLSHPSIQTIYKSPSQFMGSFDMKNDAWNYFKKMAAKDSVNIDSATPVEINFLNRYLKLSLARQLWRNEGYFELMNAEDETVKKALEELGK